LIEHYDAIPEMRRLAYKNIKSIQDLILSCSMLVTDYSSLAMDFGLIGRPVFYYQFPENPGFFGSSLFCPGYFTYARDGFGPVLDKPEELMESIRLCLERGGTREEIYEQRAWDFFTLRDGQNCSRVFEAILSRS
jgi:CDP-glycerol glycerophosphotransferase (TagB/SpsB family)